MKSMKFFMADVIHHLHTAVVLLSIGGWMMPNENLLKGYIVFMIAIMAQWALYGNRCILTVWEDELRGKGSQSGTESFIGTLIKRISGYQPSERFVDLMSYGIGVACVLLAVTRLLLLE